MYARVLLGLVYIRALIRDVLSECAMVLSSAILTFVSLWYGVLVCVRRHCIGKLSLCSLGRPAPCTWNLRREIERKLDAYAISIKQPITVLGKLN
ncbi:unnamed protein product [Chrysodeixis includens]|uniref:Uncharacterized protein n=1 Tax=Chrysodeixis includens TaxID=689277 RepID=A0A9N8KWB3_CHRIL|nr:unnamed protein product [Chrysodeixis includens]